MDYKYIEQLLERYWNCETSVEEEQILRTFFRQKDVPSHLVRYRSLFAYLDEEAKLTVSEDFEQRILDKINRPVVEAKRVTFLSRFTPLFKAAAILLLLFSVSSLVKLSLDGTSTSDVLVQAPDTLQEDVNKPQVAYQSDTLSLPVQETLRTVGDTLE